MTPLERNALARKPLTQDECRRIYETAHCMADDKPTVMAIKRICESHERLRMEAEGLGVVVPASARAAGMMTTPTELIARLERADCRCDTDVGWICERCDELMVLRALVSENDRLRFQLSQPRPTSLQEDQPWQYRSAGSTKDGLDT
jgi:hypothetical protein